MSGRALLCRRRQGGLGHVGHEDVDRAAPGERRHRRQYLPSELAYGDVPLAADLNACPVGTDSDARHPPTRQVGGDGAQWAAVQIVDSGARPNRGGEGVNVDALHEWRCRDWS